MVIYSEIQEIEIRELANNYDLDLIDWATIDGGACNSNYLLHTTKGRFILTVFEITLARVSKLGELLLILESYDFPATRLRTSSTGKKVTSYQDKPILLKPYISGQVANDLNEGMLGQVGAALAKLNEIPAPNFLPDIHYYGLQTFPSLIGRNIDLEYEVWLAQKYSLFKKSFPDDIPRGLIHGDLFIDNVLFEGEKFKAIIDFEESCRYFKVFDLGMAIAGMCTDETKIRFDKVQALVFGYQQVRLLEEREKDTLQLFIEYAAVATSSWRFWKYQIDTPSTENADLHRQMARLADEVQAIPKAKFIESVFV